MKQLLLSVVLLSLACALRADDEIQKLVDEARIILVANRESTATPHDYARCLYALEKAQALVENSGDSTSARAQEVNSLLFWAKRFSNVEIVKELEKLRAANGDKARVAAAARPAGKSAEKSVLPEAKQMTDAKAAYDAAAQFAAEKAGDPYTVSLRWFQMASQFAGTDYALKALEKARQAQALVGSSDSSKSNSVYTQRALSETEELRQEKGEYALVREGDALVLSGDFDGALEKYKQSIAIRDTIPAERHMGHAYVKLAQKLAEALTPKYAEVEAEYNRAFIGAYVNRGGYKQFNDRDSRWVAAQQKVRELQKEGDKISVHAGNAQSCFEKVLKMAPGKNDFDAAAYVGVSLAKRSATRIRARTVLKDFLEQYKPGNGEEQITYEFCKSEYERLGH
jgi:hypothetical protein